MLRDRTRQLRQAPVLSFVHLAFHQTTEGARAFGEQRQFVIAITLRYRIFVETANRIGVSSCRGIGERQ
ncbi:hypothetical protein D3C78_1707390 [compost metagenome]